ncbi:hypothetical protein LZC95_40685 [Pendulispora brunnea]|uniref:Uncharacterized protein n=1 Tax=Pendulispora brunnea TaxID=2905690 RepID=A0ABZ2K672_9BACT
MPDLDLDHDHAPSKLEELVDALERLAFSRLARENALALAGCDEEAQLMASWRDGVRAAADFVRTWPDAPNRPGT